MTQTLARYSRIVSIVGDILQVRVLDIGGRRGVRPRLGDLALTETPDGEHSLAQIVRIDRDVVSLQVFSGTKGLSTGATVRFLGHPMEVTCSPNILGRVFDGVGRALDTGPGLGQERRIPIGGPTVNPLRRHQAQADEAFDLAAVVDQALENQHHTRQLADRRDFLHKRIRELEPWGDFRFPPEEALAGYRLWFYLVPHYRLGDVRDSGLTWAVIHRDARHSHVVVVAEEEPAEDAMPVPRTHTGALSLSELRWRLARVEVELECTTTITLARCP